jgi:radical SAM protein with 4Fe4S-binding SPASM domain
VSFVEKALTKQQYTSLIYSYAGGEPLLEADVIVDLIETTQALINEKFPNLPFKNTITTNATLPLDDIRQKALHLMWHIAISIDGNEKEHNAQRHAYKTTINPYQTSLANIRHMLDIGLLDKMTIQASLADDILTREYAADFMRTFLRMGISDITIGSIHPTNVYKKTTDNYFADLKNAHIRAIPCCKFRYGAVYNTDPSGKIYDAVWEYSRNELGTIYDDPETIYENQVNNIRNQFPCFKDSNCMKCPAIGMCWGGCINGSPVIGDNPSAYCNQKKLIDKIAEYANDNTITSLSMCKIKKAE